MRVELSRSPQFDIFSGKPRSGISRLEVAVVLVIIVLLLTLLFPALQQGIEANRRVTCKNNLKQIGRALQQYHEQYGSFPPAYTIGANGEKRHSWRSLILPFLGDADLYAQIRLDEPWDSPHNKRLSDRSLNVYACPSAANRATGQTNYFAIVDPATAWPEQHAVRISDIHDGPSNSIQVIEATLPGVKWMEPRDLSRSEAIAFVKENPAKIGTNHQGGNHCEFADGNVRFINQSIDFKVMRALTSIHGGKPYPGVNWPESALPEEHKFSEPINATNLAKTDIWPVVNREIVAGRNLIYCCTFQMAWDQGCQLVEGHKLELPGELAAELNAQTFPLTDLSPASYVVFGGTGANAALVIPEELKEKFPNFKSNLPANLNVRRFVIYGMLKKNLPFLLSFDRLEKPLQFGDIPVSGFGIEKIDGDDSRHVQLTKQVKILDFVSDDDFIISLSTRSGRDEIVLAKMTHEQTLGETLATVRQRIGRPDQKHSRFHLEEDETLIVPVLSTNVDRQFSELLNQPFGNKELSLLAVTEARQIIRFHLDENGAKIESEAVVIGDNGHDHPPNPRKFVFDKPFLIWLRESQASEPYFAAWIENSELMEQR